MKRSLLDLFLRHRRAFSLAALALIAGLLFWGRLLMQDVPRTAIADPDALVAEARSLLGDVAGETAGEAEQSSVRIAVTNVNKKNDQVNQKNRGIEQKSHDHPVDEQQRRETEIRQSATQLSLQQIWPGQEPRARISDELLSPGESVHGFVVQSIQHTKVVLQKDGIVVVLEK